ncbi:helix-turn-helix domain-containing protein [Candidatus Odyssella thessalonicensis]|uniref:helix-turn-helix domain-containing protein n=1 Tax=Candidatus Odyssella thessalonicensis TaxID=84647 RepID=UPI000225B78A|nr:helix-turn-helix transcriptional regulator [Candidatus Odyssella thessalonicensis]
MFVKTPHYIDIHIGKKIKERREALNFKQKQLAERLNITSQQLSKYELGLDRMPVSHLYSLAKILAVTPNFFFDGIEGVSLALEEDSIRLSWESLKGERIELVMGQLQGTVLDIKVIPEENNG